MALKTNLRKDTNPISGFDKESYKKGVAVGAARADAWANAHGMRIPAKRGSLMLGSGK